MTIFTFDNLFLELAFIHFLSLKASNLTSAFIPRPEWIAFPPIFTADVPVGPKWRRRGLSGSLE